MTALTHRADKRAQRRFHAAAVAHVVTDGQARETRLWIEAERLLDRLERFALWSRMSEAQLDAAHEAAVADLEDLRVRDGLPDVPVAAPGELMEAWGK